MASGKDAMAECRHTIFSGIMPIHHHLQNPNLNGYLRILIYH
jgi:hypothetical protein